MVRRALVLAALLSCGLLWAADEKPASYPSYSHEIAKKHEIPPHRNVIRIGGVTDVDQLQLNLVVSPTGEVISADVEGMGEAVKFWPQLRDEVLQWRFVPFEKDGKAITAEVEEYINLFPPERLPSAHVTPPILRDDSKIIIVLERTGCLGTCPSYSVTITIEKILFNGRSNVAAEGKYTAAVNAKEVRKLAGKFVVADFYSMDDSYRAMITDSPTYVLSIDIDGRKKRVEDYVGKSVGMPEIVEQLEREVDEVAGTDRWIEGADGLVAALQGEKFNFRSLQGQALLKAAAGRGQVATVREFLKAGVPLTPLHAPKQKGADANGRVDSIGFLQSAYENPEALKIFMDVGVSKNDQGDKDGALASAAAVPNMETVRMLIDYGANPAAAFHLPPGLKDGYGTPLNPANGGSVLIGAASSGNPDLVREILSYHPNLEARDIDGKTAIFAVESRIGDDAARAECVRLLVNAGADVNARDNDGNTPLYEASGVDIVKELLNAGADVNARNKEGETPIFNTWDPDIMALLIEHGADLTIRNNDGKTAAEARRSGGTGWQSALQQAMEKLKHQ